MLFRSSIPDVQAAVEAAKEAAKTITDVVSEYIIPNPEEGTEKMLHLSGLDKN